MSNTMELSEAKRVLLAKYLQGNIPETQRVTQLIPRRPESDNAPLSYGQQQIWLLAQLMPDTPVYTECVTIHLPGPLDVEAFEQSFNTILRRHEAWRTSFPMIDGQPVQVIHPYSIVPLPIVDLTNLPEAEREAKALHLAGEDSQRPFDLAHGPLLRPMLVRLSDTNHRLFLTLHHIIFDGFSLYQIFLPELRAHYDAFVAGRPSPLPDLPIQYADFAIWQRERLQGNVLADQLAYWKKQLEDISAKLDLPTDRPRPMVPTYYGSMHSFALSKGLTDAVKALGRQESVTLYIVLVAAFKTLLYRYTGQSDNLLGTAISDRNQAETQGLMGFFLNTLVLRTDLSGNPTFRDLLQQVREVTLEAHAHQNVPFEYLVKELQPERNPGQNPLFQVLLSLEPPLSILPSGWTLTQMDVETNTAKFDLSLELDDRPEGLIGRFEYNADLFEESTIARMAGHWQTLLESIVANPTQRIAELPILREPEQHQMLIAWNDTVANYPKDQCLHQLFEAQVALTPEAIAALFEDKHLTYHELNSRANQLAHYLQKLGVGPETLVGICTERSLDMVVALLAVLKAGGAYVPLDPAYPKDRLAFTLEDAQVQVLLTKQSLVKHLPQYISKLISLDTDWEVIAQEHDENLVSETMQENLAYVIYTSGSTGRPKGVAIAHRSVVAFVVWAQSVFSSEDLAGVLASTSICFDLSVFELFVTLSSGGTVILAENVLYLPNLAAKEQVTLINTVPSAMTELLRTNSLPSSIRTVNLAGEPLHSTLVQQIYRQNTVKRVFNLYGPSEDTTYSTYALVENEESEPSIGRPISNTQVYILDAHLQPVPIGVAGELYIGGDGLAVGYLHHPELTAKRFIPNPYKVGAKLYKTDDLVRYKPDGNIEFLGRIDHQVKLRGFRIELGEIEEVLLLHPEVQEAVVRVWEDTTRGKYLAAYIVAVRDRTPLIKNLQGFLKEKLPEYMIPSTFILLDALPLTPNGKLDRRALPAPKPDSHAAEETYVAPTRMVHYQLLQIWEELVDARPIGIRDNFFFLGGHSLLAAHLVNRIEQVFGKNIPLTSLFAGPTIEHLANILLRQEDIAPPSPMIAVQVGGSKQPFFFLHGDYKGGAFYCFALARSLGAAQPFYALEPFKFDGLQIPPSIEAMAAAHNKLLRIVQPEGPYLLGGFCNGGLVAYEMARQLHAEGDTVDLLVLMNPTPIDYLNFLSTVINRFGNLIHLGKDKQLASFLWLRHMYRYLQHIYRYLRFPRYRRLQTKLDPEQANQNGGTILVLKALHELWLSYGRERSETDEQIELGPRSHNVRFALLRARLASVFPDAIFPTSEDICQDWEGIFHWTASDYVPGFYPGKSTFFFSWGWHSEVQHHYSMKWRKLAEVKDKEVEIHTIAGTHDTCKTEHLHDLTEHLRMCLNKAQGI